MYSYTDKELNRLVKAYVRIFERIKRAKRPKKVEDETVLLALTERTYERLLIVLEEVLLKIAKYACKRQCGKDDEIDFEWLMDYLGGYDPVMKFVFLNEVDRRRAKLFEAIVATKDPKGEAERAEKDFTRLTVQVAEEVTDAGNIEGIKIAGYKFVRWVSFHDAKRCAECRSLDGKIFPIDGIPVKPHPRCRCYVVPYAPDKKG